MHYLLSLFKLELGFLNKLQNFQINEQKYLFKNQTRKKYQLIYVKQFKRVNFVFIINHDGFVFKWIIYFLSRNVHLWLNIWEKVKATSIFHFKIRHQFQQNSILHETHEFPQNPCRNKWIKNIHIWIDKSFKSILKYFRSLIIIFVLVIN